MVILRFPFLEVDVFWRLCSVACLLLPLQNKDEFENIGAIFDIEVQLWPTTFLGFYFSKRKCRGRARIGTMFQPVVSSSFELSLA